MERQAWARIRECVSDTCRFRFPDLDSRNTTIRCPKCGATASIAQRINLLDDHRTDIKFKPGCETICLLDNIRSVYNVGSIFRTMQGFGVGKAFLCGITPTPHHKHFSKTSIGAEKNVIWQYERNALDQAKSLKREGYKILSLEASASAEPIYAFKGIEKLYKFVLVIGNEKIGIDPSILEISDHILSIPIFGENKSYNVTVAFGVGLYALLVDLIKS